MSDFASKFKDARWIEKREEILDRATRQCEECGVTRDDLQIHICYWKSGVEPWEYPERAYRCLCPEHRQTRKALELEIRESLCHLSGDELDSLHVTLRRLRGVAAKNRSGAFERIYATARQEAEGSPKHEEW